MKITLQEYDGCFSFDMEAETLKDAALLVRMGINATKEIRFLSAIAPSDGDFRGIVVIGKRKRPTAEVRCK